MKNNTLSTLQNLSIQSSNLKSGDVKVNASEMKQYATMVNFFVDIMASKSDMFTEEEQAEIQQYIAFKKYFESKYIELNELRLLEKQAYDIHSKVVEFKPSLNEIDTYEELKSETYEKYRECKKNRETLQIELSDLKEKSFYWMI